MIPSRRRILILYVTAGAGHHRAAEAIAQAVTKALPQAEVQCRDLLDDVPRWLARAYPATYYFLVRRLGWFWGLCYQLLDQWPVYDLVQPIRRRWNLWKARALVQRITQEPPEMIIATHFFPADVVSSLKRAGRLPSPFVVVITDLYPHQFWISRQADRYVVGSLETAAAVTRRGITSERVHVLGIPTADAFHARFGRRALEQRFGLDPNRHTVLVTGGATTVGPFEPVVESLMALETSWPGRIQLMVVCGENAAAVRRLTARANGRAMPVRVFGFIETMPEVMAVSDLVVAKAGGMVVAEALARGLPLLIYHAIPGQERWNAHYLCRQGAAVSLRRPAEAAVWVQRLLEHPEEAVRMRQAAGALRHPDAADAIVSQVVQPLLAR